MMDDEKPGAHILVVDDASLDRHILEGMLLGSHHRVSLAVDGDSALSAALACPPDLVLLDIDMPGMNGYEVCQAFKKKPQLLDIPIIFLSGEDSSQHKIRAFDSGGVDYVTKPFQEDELRARIETHLALRSYRLQLEASNQQLASSLDMVQSIQNKLVQAEKMASIGTLAAGVAHEINNPIGYISSNLSCLTRYFDDIDQLLSAYEAMESKVESADQLASVQQIKQAIDLPMLRVDIKDLISESCEGATRVKNIVQDLKDFSHTDEGESVFVDLHAGIESTLSVAWHEIKYKAKVIKQYGDIPQVKCQSSKINQVFLNMLINAAQAIEQQGAIQIRTGLGTTDDWVYVEIEDDGCGIPQQHLGQLFDPFYTTKPVGKGTGLGLSLSQGIIEQHGGTIEVRSEPGKGSCFRINLPVQFDVDD